MMTNKDMPTQDSVAGGGALTAARGAPSPDQGQGANGFAQGAPDPELMDLYERTVDYTRNMLAEGSKEILAAMKADPVSAAVQFGVRALRAVAQAAGKAGRPLPPEVVLAAGVQVIKDLAAAAESNGLLPEGQEEVFLKEAVQQAVALFAQLDQEEGLIKPEDMQKLQGMGGGGAPQGAPPPTRGGGGAIGAAMQGGA